MPNQEGLRRLWRHLQFRHLPESEPLKLHPDPKIAARDKRIREGRKVLGVARILAQNPSSQPKSHAPRFKLSPGLAAKSKWARIETLLRNRVFQEKYRDAIKRHLAGAANVLFPFGTFWMKKFGKVACETADKLGPAGDLQLAVSV